GEEINYNSWMEAFGVVSCRRLSSLRQNVSLVTSRTRTQFCRRLESLRHVGSTISRRAVWQSRASLSLCGDRKYWPYERLRQTCSRSQPAHWAPCANGRSRQSSPYGRDPLSDPRSSSPPSGSFSQDSNECRSPICRLPCP